MSDVHLLHRLAPEVSAGTPSDVNVLYIVTAVVLAGLAVWAGYVLFTAEDAPDESPQAEDEDDDKDEDRDRGLPRPTVPGIHEAKTAKRRVIIMDETPPPATIEVSVPSERAILVANQSAPVVILPTMRQRLDSHTEIRDDGSTGPAGAAGGGVDILGLTPGADDTDEGARESMGPMSGVVWSLVSAIGHSDASQGPTERSAIVDRHRLFVVANGGGQRVNDGLVSTVLVDALTLAFEADSTTTFSAEPALPPRADRLRRAVLTADAAVRTRTTDRALDLNKVGVLAAHFSPDNRHLFIATAGLDRAYRLRGQEVTQLNKASLAPAGALPGEGRAVDMYVGETLPEDVYVFGSDMAFLALGDELRSVLTFDASIERVAAHFVAAATRQGMTMGTTAIVVRVDSIRSSARPTTS